MREDKSDLRAKVYSLEMSKERLEITVNTLQSQIMALESQLMDSQQSKNSRVSSLPRQPLCVDSLRIGLVSKKCFQNFCTTCVRLF